MLQFEYSHFPNKLIRILLFSVTFNYHVLIFILYVKSFLVKGYD